MSLSDLVLFITEDCNFDCKYCYHIMGKSVMSRELIKDSLDFFLEYLEESHTIHFLGGEPLLEFDLIKETIEHIEKKNKSLKKTATPALTTNGSLLTEKILEYMNAHHFKMGISFDGLPQNRSRKKGSFEHLVPIIKKTITYPDINFDTSSVFSPETVGELSESMKFILDLGVDRTEFSLATNTPWDAKTLNTFQKELAKLRKIVLEYHKKTGNIPIPFFEEKEKKGIWQCSAGDSLLTITPDGNIWGCALFHEYFKDKKNSKEFNEFCFGNFYDFKKNHKDKYGDILLNYGRFSMDDFRTADSWCMKCQEVEKCRICPVMPAFNGTPLGIVPDYECRISKIQIREKEKFQKELKSIN